MSSQSQAPFQRQMLLARVNSSQTLLEVKLEAEGGERRAPGLGTREAILARGSVLSQFSKKNVRSTFRLLYKSESNTGGDLRNPAVNASTQPHWSGTGTPDKAAWRG